MAKIQHCQNLAWPKLSMAKMCTKECCKNPHSLWLLLCHDHHQICSLFDCTPRVCYSYTLFVGSILGAQVLNIHTLLCVLIWKKKRLLLSVSELKLSWDCICCNLMEEWEECIFVHCVSSHWLQVSRLVALPHFKLNWGIKHVFAYLYHISVVARLQEIFEPWNTVYSQ